MILRELIAIFGLEYDDEGQKEAEKGLEGLKNQADAVAGAFSQILAAGAISAPFLFLTKMASDAQENLNLLELAFGDSADSIVKWSNEVGPAMGRSRFTMRELAAEIGGLLQPMVGSGEALADMSTNLAQLAVDLSSARNVGEIEALSAIQSGLSGNIIALKRFGVNLNQTRVQTEALSRGLSGNTRELTQAQLAAIRYDLIMKDLSFIQGDAAKTQFGFANSARALRDALKDIGTEFGLFLLPAFESALRSTRELLEPVAKAAAQFREWAANTNLAKGALIALGAIVTAVLIPPLLAVLPFIAAFGALALAIDDVITFLEGGSSVLGRFVGFLDAVDGGAIEGLNPIWEAMIWLINRARDAVGWFVSFISQAFSALISGDFTAITQAWNDLLEWISTGWQNFSFGDLWEWIKNAAMGAGDFIRDSWTALVDWMVDKWGDFKIDFAPQLQALGGFLGDVSKKIASFLNTPIGKALFALLGAYVGKKIGASAGGGLGGSIGSLLGKSKIPGSEALGTFLGGKLGGIGGGLTGALSGLVAGGGSAGDLANVFDQIGGTLQGGGSIGQSSLPLPAQGALFQQGDKTFSISLQQQAGESSEDFAIRVAEEIEKSNEASDLELFNELVQQPAGA